MLSHILPSADHIALVEALVARRFTAVARHIAEAPLAEIDALIPINPTDSPPELDDEGVGPDLDTLRTSAAWIACYHPDLLPLVVSIGADINQHFSNDYGQTLPLLGAAVMSGLEDVVIWLIDHGAALDPVDPSDSFETPLYTAVDLGMRSIVELLLLRGASANHTSMGKHPYDLFGTPLETAILRDTDPHIKELLLAYGADSYGCRPYSIAILSLERLEWFLSNTSYPLARQANENGSVLYHAIDRDFYLFPGKAETVRAKVRLLVQRGAPIESAGRYAAIAKSLLD